MPTGQLSADFKRQLWEADLNPDAPRPVLVKIHVKFLRFASRQLPLEDVTLDRMSPLGTVQGREPALRMGSHPLRGLHRVAVSHIKRYQEARIDVDAQ